MLHLGLSFASLLSSALAPRRGDGSLTIPGSHREKGRGVANSGIFGHCPHGTDLLSEEIAFPINKLESFCQCQFQEKTISKGHIDP